MNDLTIVNVSSAVSYQETCKWLALCEDRAECKDIADKSRALEELAKRIKNTDAERRACNIRLVAERRYGELLKDLARATPEDAGAKGNAAQGKHAPPTAGVRHHTRKRSPATKSAVKLRAGIRRWRMFRRTFLMMRCGLQKSRARGD
ncbi:MAG: hypothetical protein IPK42_11225 [Betaproteobacteria bacterium]|nr:hypothetical protein [Betaproteobacteria bacterium]